MPTACSRPRSRVGSPTKLIFGKIEISGDAGTLRSHGIPMGQQAENRDFLRFRDGGDPKALARVFDRTAPRLLLLAAHLSPDAAAAEDLVQATFLSAIASASQFDGKRPVSAWLSGILRHRASDAQRQGAIRRAQPLDELAGGLAIEARELEGNEELFEHVSSAVDALPEPYREVLVLRLVHGLEPTQIAHSLGRKPGTVRMQLMRGLESLRKGLPQYASLLAISSAVDARGLQAVREAVMAEASSLATASTVASSSAGSLSMLSANKGILGGILVMKSIWIALALGIGALWVALGSEDSVRQTAIAGTRDVLEGTESIAVELHEATQAERQSVAQPTVEPRPEDAFAVNSTSSSAAFEVHIRYGSDNTDAANIGLYLRPESGPELGLEGRTDQNGVFSFDAPPSGPVSLHVDRMQTPKQLSNCAGQALELWIPRGRNLDGVVLDLDGNPVPGARIYRFNGAHHDRMQEISRADSNGRFLIRDVCDDPNEQFLARSNGFQPSELRRLPRQADEEMELVMGARGNLLRGSVLDWDGQAVPFAQIAIGVDEDAREAIGGSNRRPGIGTTRKPLDLETFYLRADENGQFESDEVPAGYALIMARPKEENANAIGMESIWLESGQLQEIKVVIQKGARLDGVIRNQNGSPAADVIIRAEWEGSHALGKMEDNLGALMSDVETTSGPDGAYSLIGMLPGEFGIELRGPGNKELLEEERFFAPGSEQTWDPIVEAGESLNLKLLDRIGSPLEGWGLSIAGPGFFFSERVPARTNSMGEISVPFLEPDGLYDVGLFAPRSTGGLQEVLTAFRSGLAPGSAQHVLQLSATELPTAVISGSWLDTAGEPLGRTSLLLVRAGHTDEWALTTNADGRFAFDGLSAGDYQLRAGASPYPRGTVIASFSVAAEERLNLGQIALQGLCKIKVGVSLTSDEAPPRAALFLESAEASAEDLGVKWTQSDSIWTSTPIVPGRYLLRIQAPGHAPYTRKVQVGSQAELFLEARLQAGFSVPLSIQLPATANKSCLLLVRVWDTEQTLVSENNVFAYFSNEASASGHELKYSVLLAPGNYRIEVGLTGESATPAEASFGFSQGNAAEMQPVALDLR